MAARSDAAPPAAVTDRVAAATSARLGRVPAAVVVAIALAWAASIAAEVGGVAHYVHHDVLLENGPPLEVALVAFLLAWQVMIAAMMLPSSLPLVRLFASASAGQARPGAAMAGFLGGYAAVWSAFGALALVFDLGVHRSVDSIGWLHEHDWLIGGSVLAVAGAFQFTKLKDACLDKCRHPAQFMFRYYERGAGGGFRLGARHGAYCVACCWALMLVMFAAGVASLVWMALLTALMVHEKTRPAGRRAVPVTGGHAAGDGLGGAALLGLRGRGDLIAAAFARRGRPPGANLVSDPAPTVWVPESFRGAHRLWTRNRRRPPRPASPR